MNARIGRLLRTLLLDGRLVLAGFLLLAVIFVDFLFLHRIVPELDSLEHFLFGFVLSQLSSRAANAMALDESLTRRLGHKDSRRADLLVRLMGFFLLGGLLWEASERYVFPLFGSRPEPFFSFPITIANVDGTIDVAVGTVGCLLAWYLAKS